MLGSEDLRAILHCNWADDAHRYSLERKRVQLAFMALLCAYTSSRPGTIVESSCPGLRGTGEALLWRDIELWKVVHPDPSRGTVIFFKITFGLMKGRRAKDKEGEP